jgi:hypothetical protein
MKRLSEEDLVRDETVRQLIAMNKELEEIIAERDRTIAMLTRQIADEDDLHQAELEVLCGDLGRQHPLCEEVEE